MSYDTIKHEKQSPTTTTAPQVNSLPKYSLDLFDLFHAQTRKTKTKQLSPTIVHLLLSFCLSVVLSSTHLLQKMLSIPPQLPVISQLSAATPDAILAANSSAPPATTPGISITFTPHGDVAGPTPPHEGYNRLLSLPPEFFFPRGDVETAAVAVPPAGGALLPIL